MPTYNNFERYERAIWKFDKYRILRIIKVVLKFFHMCVCGGGKKGIKAVQYPQKTLDLDKC